VRQGIEIDTPSHVKVTSKPVIPPYRYFRRIRSGSSDTLSTDNWDPPSRTILARFVHFAKQYKEIVFTDEGIQTDRSDEQNANADSQSSAILQPDSNDKCESFVQYLKHEFWMISIDEGRQIDRSE
jgi:hypothetical protein